MLPTPTASDGTTGSIIGKNDSFTVNSTGTLRKKTGNGTDGSIGLGRYVQFFPTPTASDYKGRGPNSKQQGLPEKVKLYPTPLASDATKWNNMTEEERRAK
ncbi:hypothetical protein, partial [Bacillus subtilis]|uniref:hypothetical protein n=1 Tax=Bacillus subtilis TaxID=1423 RepID=UPI002DBBBA6F